MGSIKTDSIEFATQRSLKDLTNALRRAISTTKAQVDRLEADDDPLGNDDVQPLSGIIQLGTVDSLEAFNIFLTMLHNFFPPCGNSD